MAFDAGRTGVLLVVDELEGEWRQGEIQNVMSQQCDGTGRL